MTAPSAAVRMDTVLIIKLPFQSTDCLATRVNSYWRLAPAPPTASPDSSRALHIHPPRQRAGSGPELRPMPRPRHTRTSVERRRARAGVVGTGGLYARCTARTARLPHHRDRTGRRGVRRGDAHRSSPRPRTTSARARTRRLRALLRRPARLHTEARDGRRTTRPKKRPCDRARHEERPSARSLAPRRRRSPRRGRIPHPGWRSRRIRTWSPDRDCPPKGAPRTRGRMPPRQHRESQSARRDDYRISNSRS